MRWRFDFIEHPPGSQLTQIERFKTGDFCGELFAFLSDTFSVANITA